MKKLIDYNVPKYKWTFPPTFYYEKLLTCNKIERFYSGHVCSHYPDSTTGFLSILTYHIPFHSSIHQSILFFWCISKKVPDISKLPKYFNMLNNILMYFSHQHLNCDHVSWMAYVLKISVQRQDLEIRPLQRNRNVRIKSLTIAHVE